MNEQIAKFVLGVRPMGEWDSYVKEINDLGLQQLLDLYNDTYKNMKK